MTLTVLAAGSALSVLAFGASQAVPITATEGIGFTGTVATVDGLTCPTCTATIAWGDGHTSPGSVGDNIGGGSPAYPVTGSHTYVDEGAYTVTVTADDGARGTQTTTGPATVVDAPLTATGKDASAPRGKLLRQPFATFTDANPGGVKGDFTATIDWGDGTAATAASVEDNPGGFAVIGQHAYAAAGTYAGKVTIADKGGATAQASFQATISETLKPTAAFTLSQEPPIAGQPTQLDGSSSIVADGAGPATYQWLICEGKKIKIGHGACSPTVTQTGVKIDHAFPFAEVHDKGQFSEAKGGQRRQTYLVTLKVTDAFGRVGTKTRFVTVVADTPPVASFQLTGDGDVMAPRHVISDSKDVDPQDRIVEEDWDLSGDLVADVICIPGAGCTLGPHAAGLPNYGPPGTPIGLSDLQTKQQRLSPQVGAQIDKKIQQIDKAPLPGKGPAPQEKVSIDAPQAQGQAGAGPRAVRPAPSPYPKSGVPRFSMFTVDAKANRLGQLGFTWNFGDQRLFQTGLSRLPDPVEILQVNDGNATQAHLAAFLADYAWLAQRYGLAFPGRKGWDGQHPSFPDFVTLTVKDRSGATATAKRAVEFKANDYPQARMRYVHVDPGSQPAVNQPLQATLDTGDAPANGPDLLDLTGTTDADDEIAYYTLQIGQPSDAPCGQGVKYPSMANLFAGQSPTHVCKTNLGVTNVVRTAFSTTIEGLKTQLPPTAGTYSIGLRVYDELGLAGQTRLDGIKVAPTGTCVPLDQFGIERDGASFTVSAACTDNTGKDVIKMPRGANINGVTLVPKAPGDYLVLDTTDPKNANISSHAAGGVEVLADGLSLGTIAKFDASAGAALLTLRSGDDFFEVDVAPGAAYRGLDLSPGSLGVQLKEGSTSSTRFRMLIPVGGASTDFVNIEGANPPDDKVTATTYGGMVRSARPRVDVQATADIDTEAVEFGPLHLPPLHLHFDLVTGAWTAEAHDVAIPGLPPGGPGATEARADLKLVMKGGSLVSATGDIKTSFPIAPPVYATGLHFVINDEPSLIGQIDVTAAGILNGQGTIAIHPLVPRLRLDGTVRLGQPPLDLPLGSAFVDVFRAVDGSPTVMFGGQVGADLGPASFHASVGGGIGGGGYYIEGSGEGCMFACLTISAIASNLGVAGCGEIDLWVTTVEAGFGYGFGEPGGPDGLSIWVDSCDIGAFKPVLSGAGGRADRPPTVSKGTVTLKSDEHPDALTIVAHGIKAGDDAPRITVRGPKGDPRVVKTPAVPGEYDFGNVGELALATPKGERPTGTKQGTTFLDANPLNHTTTVFIGKPGAGDWEVTVDKGSLGVTDFSYAKSLPRIKWGAIDASVGKVARGKASAAAAKGVSVARVPALERKRLRQLTVKTPPGTPKLVLVDAGPAGSQILGKTDGGKDKTAIAFDPLADGGKHAIRAIALHPNGLPRAAYTLLKYTSPKAATPPRPKIVAIQRKAGKAILVLDTDPAPKASDALAFLVLAKTSDGVVLRLPVLRGQVKKLGAKWAITLPGVDKGAKLDVTVAGAFDGAFGPKAKTSSKGR